MIADKLSKTLERYAVEPLRPNLTYAQYRIEIASRWDGKHTVSVLVLDDVPKARWTGRYIHVVDTYAQAQLAKANMAARLRDRSCLPCGSPLLDEEIHEYRGVCCHSCDGVRQANGGRWPP